MVAAPASQSEHLCRTKRSLSDKGTPRSHLAMGKSRAGKIFSENFEKPPLRLPEPGLFPLQYYNRADAKTNPRCGLERTGADIGTEVFLSVVSCSMKGRFSYSGHYPDINRMKRKTVF